MKRINELNKNERLLILQDLVSGKIQIEDCKLEIHTNFLKGPPVLFIDVRCVYSKRFKEKYFITDMQANQFFSITNFKYINNIATMSFKAINKAMGIYKIDFTAEDKRTVYENLLLQTEEYIEFSGSSP